MVSLSALIKIVLRIHGRMLSNKHDKNVQCNRANSPSPLVPDTEFGGQVEEIREGVKKQRR